MRITLDADTVEITTQPDGTIVIKGKGNATIQTGTQPVIPSWPTAPLQPLNPWYTPPVTCGPVIKQPFTTCGVAGNA